MLQTNPAFEGLADISEIRRFDADGADADLARAFPGFVESFGRSPDEIGLQILHRPHHLQVGPGDVLVEFQEYDATSGEPILVIRSLNKNDPRVIGAGASALRIMRDGRAIPTGYCPNGCHL